MHIDNSELKIKLPTRPQATVSELSVRKFVAANHPSRIVKENITPAALLEAAKRRKNVDYLSPFELLRKKLSGQP